MTLNKTLNYNIIIPAAGEGSRLSLPYPKELHNLQLNKALIDYTLDHLIAQKDRVDSITVIINRQKTALLDYLDRYKNDFYFRFIFFNPDYSEWPGSILSSKRDFSLRNIVLLPDSILDFFENQNLFDVYDCIFDEASQGFTVAKPTKLNSINQLGALSVNYQGSVTKFCDKPKSNFESYNAFWTSFGFTQKSGPNLLKKMMASIGGNPQNIGEAHAIFIKSYQDLGTWKSIEAFLNQEL